MLDELSIVTKIREGDIKAFEELFRRYYFPLCWYAAGITGETDSAEEIVEELFYTLWKNRGQLPVFQSLKNYLYRSVRNESIQYCERQDVKERYRMQVESRQEEDVFNPQDELEYKELQTLVQQILDRQPERRRRIFKMHRMQGMKYEQIASALSVSVKTVEAEMTKVLKALRNEIDNYIRMK